MAKNRNKDCFIIMPIADTEGYSEGHFGHVYENIIKPACVSSGYEAVRADEVKETNLIHLDILKKLIEAPIAICDLSSRNPNVLFELGIRQAFDKPVVLIQEEGTPKIFDIAPLRYLEYSKDMKYHDVLSIQESLKLSIEATAKAESDSSNVNSIVKLLALDSAAQIPDLGSGKEALAIDVLQAELRDMRHIMELSVMDRRKASSKGSISSIEYERISNQLDRIENGVGRRLDNGLKSEKLHNLMRDTEMAMGNMESKSEHRYFRNLMERIHIALSNMQ